MNNPNFPTPGAGVDQLQAFDQSVLSGDYYFVPRLELVSAPLCLMTSSRLINAKHRNVSYATAVVVVLMASNFWF